MRKQIFFLLLLFAPAAVFAQLSMKIMLSQDAYLQYEPIYVRVAIRNLSAHPLAFGEAGGLRGTIHFDIYPGGKNVFRIPPKNRLEMPSLTGAILQPGAVHNFTFKLSQYYDLRKLGPFSIKAVVSHPQLPSAYESNTVHCNVVEGMKVWGPVPVGIPDLESENPRTAVKKIKTRRYSIVSYFTGKVTAYALILDDEEKNYMVRRIGFDLGSNLRPVCEIDFLSRLNVMIAASPTVFAYYQFNTDDKLERKKVYIKTSTTPTLVYDKDTGIVMPVGGREARREIDYEEIKDLPFTEDMFNQKSKLMPSGIEDSDGPVRSSGLE